MELAVIAIVALLIGAGLGWFVGSRPVAGWKARFEDRDGEARAGEDKLKDMTRDLATMSERAARADALGEKLDQEREAHGALKEKAAGFEERERLLVEAQANLLKEFENTGAKVLDAAQEKLLASATERFGHSEKSSEEKIKALLAPVGERLKKYEDQVAALEEKRTDAFGQLTGLIESMKVGQEGVRREAQRLGDSLRNAPKIRGRWGEQALNNVLTQCGLSEYTDFITEKSVETDGGRQRPDAIVKMPGQKLLVIDAKVSLNAYQDAFEAENDEEREKALDAHLKSMKSHIQQLGDKEYQKQFDQAPDYVVMFVPGEHFISAAEEQDAKRKRRGFDEPDLWNFAYDRGVLLASPTNLVAIAKSIHQVWGQVHLEQEAKEISKLGGLLYDSLLKSQGDLQKVGRNLDIAVRSYNDFVKTYDGNALSRARRLSEKHISSSSKSLADDVPFIEHTPAIPHHDSSTGE